MDSRKSSEENSVEKEILPVPMPTNTSQSSEDVRVKAHNVCKDYLHGAWQLISADQMTFKSISGGLSNLLFLCELPVWQRPVGEEPALVLLRMYGQVRDGAHESTITESVIFTLLAERKLGPKLYGIFPGGRLEEYIQAAPLSCDELRQPDISEQVALRMAQIHNLKIPICKEPVFLWSTMKTWVNLSHKCLDDSSLSKYHDKRDIINQLRSVSFEREMDWLRQYVSRYHSPVIFCHNDCQEGNILKHSCTQKDWSAASDESHYNVRLTLIDFEYCSYNYRGFDIANHFCEWMYDYTMEQYPNFLNSPERYPTTQQQLRFIRAYLRARDGNPDMNVANSNNSSEGKTDKDIVTSASVYTNTRTENPNIGKQDQTEKHEITAMPAHQTTESIKDYFSEHGGTDCDWMTALVGERNITEEEQQVLAEARVHQLSSHLFWCLWSVVNAPVSTIQFGYWEYGLCRLKAYQEAKHELIRCMEKHKQCFKHSSSYPDNTSHSSPS